MQTIYTVVSKPVRRFELILGRIIGYMTIVTALTLIFGGISLVYLYRNIQGTIDEITTTAKKIQATDPDRARVLERAGRPAWRTRMSARLPLKGSLTFVDSKGTPSIKGIDVGQELEYRSHIEGATEAAADLALRSIQRPRPATIPGGDSTARSRSTRSSGPGRSRRSITRPSTPGLPRQDQRAAGAGPESATTEDKARIAAEVAQNTAEIQRLKARIAEASATSTTP